MEQSTSISGTANDGDVVQLYIDGVALTDANETLSGTTTWTISGLATYDFSTGSLVTVTATASGMCESDASAASEVVCSAPTIPVVTSGDYSYCDGSSGEYTLAGSESNVLYEMVNGSGTSLGIQAIGTGSAITLYSDALIADLNSVFVKATKLFDASCSSTSVASFNFTPLEASPSVELTLTTVQVVSGSTTADFEYINADNSPTNYLIDFSIAAENENFADVTSTSLPTTPIVLTVPGAAATGSYTAVLTITSASSCESTYNIVVEIQDASADAVIGTQPANVTKCSGESATFSVSATNATAYQWEVDNQLGGGFVSLSDVGVYSGSTTANLSISSITGLDSYQYQVQVTGTSLNVTPSDPATLTEVTITPGTIGSDQSIASGATPSGLTSIVDATGSSLTYQWQKSEDAVSYGAISGATSATYSPGSSYSNNLL